MNYNHDPHKIIVRYCKLNDTVNRLLTLDNDTLMELMRIIRKKGEAVVGENYATAAHLRDEER